MTRHHVIVGNGVAGATAALTLRERDSTAKITMISPEAPYFFSRTALMYAFMNRLERRDLEPYERRSWRERGIDLCHDRVSALDATARTLATASGASLRYDRLLIATGSSPRPIELPGLSEATDGVVNFVSLQDLDRCERLTPSTRRAVVIGGGLIGIELVECLLHHGVATTFFVREPWFWPVALSKEESDMVSEHMRHHGVDLRFDTEVARVVSDAQGRVSSVVTTAGESLPCELLGVCIGVVPNVAWLRGLASSPAVARGVKVDATLKTSLPDVWAAGDCAEIDFGDGERPLVEQIWYSARRQGALAAANMTGRPSRYQPPTFFNSAKLFEIEYTTAGDLLRLPQGARSVYRRHPSRAISQRVVHHEGRVLGFNMLGSRWDHTVLSDWIEQARELPWVLSNLHRAQFDVEFGRADLSRCVERDLPITAAHSRAGGAS